MIEFYREKEPIPLKNGGERTESFLKKKKKIQMVKRHLKKLYITLDQGKANRNINVISPHPVRMTLNTKKLKTTSVSGDVEKGNTLLMLVKRQLAQPIWKIICTLLKINLRKSEELRQKIWKHVLLLTINWIQE